MKVEGETEERKKKEKRARSKLLKLSPQPLPIGRIRKVHFREKGERKKKKSNQKRAVDLHKNKRVKGGGETTGTVTTIRSE